MNKTFWPRLTSFLLIVLVINLINPTFVLHAFFLPIWAIFFLLFFSILKPSLPKKIKVKIKQTLLSNSTFLFLVIVCASILMFLLFSNYNFASLQSVFKILVRVVFLVVLLIVTYKLYRDL